MKDSSNLNIREQWGDVQGVPHDHSTPLTPRSRVVKHEIPKRSVDIHVQSYGQLRSTPFSSNEVITTSNLSMAAAVVLMFQWADAEWSQCIFSSKWLRINVKALSIIKWNEINWAASSEFVSSSIPSWQILTAHAQPFRGATDLAFCLQVPLASLLVWASSGGSGETARMRRLAWTFAARIGDKYQIRLTWPK